MALDLSIAAGDLYGFLGPNGAGKTTTMRLLAGLLKPDAGSMRLAGIDPATDPRAVRAAGERSRSLPPRC